MNLKFVKRLGSGGFGIVDLMEDEATGKLYALKKLRITDDKTKLKAFRHEVEGLKSLDHPGIIKIISSDLDDTPPYYVMPFYKSGSLVDFINLIKTEGKRIPPKDVLSIILQISYAVEYLHNKKIYHRDIKPENILLSDDGNYILSDFGISKFSDMSSFGITGANLGTMGYMAPEQLITGKGSVKADIFSLGVVFYNLITFKRPETNDQGYIISKPSDIIDEISIEYDELFRSMCSYDADKRMQSCAVLREKIKRILDRKYDIIEPQTEPWQDLLAALLAIGTIVVVVAAIIDGGKK